MENQKELPPASSEHKPPSKAPMTKKKKLILSGFVVLTLIGVGYFAWDRYTYIYTDDATVQAHTTLLSPKVNGIVVQVNVDEHQRVKAGEVLVQLEQKDYRAALANAEATLQSTQAQYRNAELDYTRNLSLIRQKAITRQAYDRADANYKDLDRRVRAAQANVDQAKLNLDYTFVRAPTDGTIARKSVEAGMFANVGTSLFGFVQDDDRWVIANYKETDLDMIVPGKAAEVEVDAIPGKTYDGYVESISPSTGSTFTLLPPDNATGNFTKVVQRVPVKIRLKNLSAEDMERLQAGLSSEVNILKHSRPQRVPPQRPTPAYLSQMEPKVPKGAQDGEAMEDRAQSGAQAAGQSSANLTGK